ncbi:MAG: FAD-binding protein, partial [Anaerolineae bacterium]
YVHLDVRPETVNRYLAEACEDRRVDADYILSKLPDITDFCHTYLGIDPTKSPIPIQPTAHYGMGGIPTNLDAAVISAGTGTVVPGLYAAGEVACVSVHGANRLGTNSLTDLIVFGRKAGKAMADYARQADFVPLPADPAGPIVAEIERIRKSSGKTKPYMIRQEMQKVMMDHVSVFREAPGLQKALDTVRELKSRFQNDLAIEDRGMRFNTDLLEAWELGCMLDLAEITTLSAIERKESRGGHSREDYPKRDDVNFLVHTMAYPEKGGIRIAHDRAVDLSLGYQPAERVY